MHTQTAANQSKYRAMLLTIFKIILLQRKFQSGGVFLLVLMLTNANVKTI